MKGFVLATLSIWFLVGCASPPIAPLTNSEGVSLSKLEYGDVVLTTGVVDGSIYTGAYTKIYKWHFDRSAQQEFVDIFKSKLKEAGAHRVYENKENNNIEVVFNKTFYESNSRSLYLDVSMLVFRNGSKESFHYKLNSRDEISTKEFWSFTQANHRNVVTQKLLDLMLKDLSIL